MSASVTGETRVAGVIGDPVRHSLSPVLHNAAFTALRLDWVYVAFPVAAGGARAALDAMRTLDLAGLSVTMPHKTDVAAACDDLTPDAAALRSVNTVVPMGGGRLLGDSTDGEGFIRSMREAGHDPGGRRVLILGAGGAARAVALAMGREGSAVTVAARRPEAASEAAALAPGGEAVGWESLALLVPAAEVLINATPVGMSSNGLPVEAVALHAGQVVADLVYHPRETPLLQAAAAAGAATVDGFGMLVHQAALALEKWTGERAPVGVMRAAAEATLSGSG